MLFFAYVIMAIFKPIFFINYFERNDQNKAIIKQIFDINNEKERHHQTNVGLSF